MHVDNQTVVPVPAGTEHLVMLDAAQARELTARIRLGLESVWELIKDAYRGRAWLLLGYGTWDEYCAREFGNLPMQPPREDRQQVIESLRGAGLSIRAIGAATGLGNATVHAALASTSSPVIAEVGVVGVDGKNYAPSVPARGPERATDVGMDAVLPAEMGIGLLDLPSVLTAPGGRSRFVAARKLTASSKAPLPQVISLANEVMNGQQLLPGTGEEAEDLTHLGVASSRGILTLSHLVSSLGTDSFGQDALELANNLQDAINVLGKVLDEIHAR